MRQSHRGGASIIVLSDRGGALEPGSEVRGWGQDGELACVARSRHATVYRGVNAMGTPYCLKIVSSAAAVPCLPAACERLARVQRQHADAGPVPRVISHGPVRTEEAATGYYLVTSWVEGQNLGQLLHEGALDRVGRLALARAVAVAAARLAELDDGATFLHLDVKPTNVIVAPRAGGAWRATLVDLDTACYADRIPSRVPATIRYAAPELRTRTGARAPGRAADVYAAALTVLEVLAGRRAVEPADLLARLPEGDRAALLPALARDSRERPDAAAFARAIGQLA